MSQDLVIETAQAMNDMRLSISYAANAARPAAETQEVTQTLISYLDPDPSIPPVVLGQIIDTYA